MASPVRRRSPQGQKKDSGNPIPLLGDMKLLFLRYWDHVKKYWEKREAPSTPQIPFEIPCECGQPVTGFRKATYQVSKCPGCGEEVFVLPWSAYTSAGPNLAENLSHTSPRRVSRLWMVGGVAFVIVLLTLILIVALQTQGPETKGQPETFQNKEETQRQIKTHLNQAHEDISMGHFSLALNRLNAAQNLHDKAQCLSKEEARSLKTLQKEIALFDDLLHRSLEELLQEAHNQPPEEWELLFRKRYQGKAIILDTVVQRNHQQVLVVNYALQVGRETVHLSLAELELFEKLPLPEPRRILWAARLEEIQREPRQGWTIHFDPQSGLLLTEKKALLHYCPALDNPETHELLQQQKEQRKMLGMGK